MANLPARVDVVDTRVALTPANSPGTASAKITKRKKRQSPNNIATALTEWRHFH